jgi:purine-cytosine permease-like protein
MVVSSFAIGALATPVFFLGFVDSVLTILFFNLLGILPVAFFSTFGPVFGLRQMVLSRFFYGFYGVKISAVLLSLLYGLYFDIYIQLLCSTSLHALAGLVLTLSLVLSCYTR